MMNLVQIAIGYLWAAIGAFLYLGQLISAVNFPLAQRLGLQEKTENADPLIRKLEIMAARCDLTVLWIPPVAGVLILFDHPWWPALSLVAGGLYLDTGARELAKVLGLKSHGVSIGDGRELIVIYCTFAFLILAGLGGIVSGLVKCV